MEKYFLLCDIRFIKIILMLLKLVGILKYIRLCKWVLFLKYDSYNLDIFWLGNVYLYSYINMLFIWYFYIFVGKFYVNNMLMNFLKGGNFNFDNVLIRFSIIWYFYVIV